MTKEHPPARPIFNQVERRLAVGMATDIGHRFILGNFRLTKGEGRVGACSVYCARNLLGFLSINHRWLLLNTLPTRS